MADFRDKLDSDPEEGECSSGDDLPIPPPLMKPEPPLSELNPCKQKQRKGNLWGSVIQERTIASSIDGISNITAEDEKKVNRGSESYRIPNKLDDIEDSQPPKDIDEENSTEQSTVASSLDDVESFGMLGKGTVIPVKRRLGKRKPVEDIDLESDQCKRVNLQPSMTYEEKKAALDISQELKEAKVDVIERLISLKGIGLANRLLTETNEIESNGGMMTLDGKRRRTPGGVYFRLLKLSSELSQEEVTEIFGPQVDWRARKATRKKLKERLGKKETVDVEMNCEQSADISEPTIEIDLS